MTFVGILKPVIQKFPLLESYYRYRRNAASLSRKVMYREKLGFHFNGPTTMEEGTFEPQETLIFDKVIGSFDTLINIGANTGYYVCRALHNNVDCVAFEPNQLNINILLRNIEANNFSSEFQLFPVALSDKLGVLPMYGDSTGASLVGGWAGQVNKTLVPISTFDKTASPLIADKKCFVLIDIEGAELGCLKGCEKLLSSPEDNVFLIEISVNEHQPVGTIINPNLLQTFELMASFDYVAYTVDGSLRRVELSEVQKVADTTIDTLGTHNFLFIKSNTQLSDIGL